jgi:hypothetical protein
MSYNKELSSKSVVLTDSWIAFSAIPSDGVVESHLSATLLPTTYQYRNIGVGIYTGCETLQMTFEALDVQQYPIKNASYDEGTSQPSPENTFKSFVPVRVITTCGAGHTAVRQFSHYMAVFNSGCLPSEIGRACPVLCSTVEGTTDKLFATAQICMKPQVRDCARLVLDIELIY